MDPCMRQIRNLIHQNEQWVPDSYITKGNRKNSQWNCSASYISNKKTAYLALIALNINFDNKRISHCNGYNILKSNQKQKLLTLHSQPSMSTLRTSRSAVATDRTSSNWTVNRNSLPCTHSPQCPLWEREDLPLQQREHPRIVQNTLGLQPRK